MTPKMHGGRDAGCLEARRSQSGVWEPHETIFHVSRVGYSSLASMPECQVYPEKEESR